MWITDLGERVIYLTKYGNIDFNTIMNMTVDDLIYWSSALGKVINKENEAINGE